MSKLRWLIVVSLSIAAWAAVASANDTNTNKKRFWVCHNGRPLNVGSVRAVIAHIRHGDPIPDGTRTCP